MQKTNHVLHGLFLLRWGRKKNICPFFYNNDEKWWEHLKKKSHSFPPLLASGKAMCGESSCFFLITSQSCSHGERILSQMMPPAALSRIDDEKSKQHPATCSLRCGAPVGPGTLSRNSWLRLREAPHSAFGPAALQLKTPPSSFPSITCRRVVGVRASLLIRYQTTPLLLLLLLRTVVSGATATQRTGAEPEEQPATGERSYRRAGGGRIGIISPLGIIILCTSPDASNMRVRSKGLAGITALVAAMLLGSCGTGEKGERLRALSWGAERAEERRKALLSLRGYNRASEMGCRGGFSVVSIRINHYKRKKENREPRYVELS